MGGCTSVLCVADGWVHISTVCCRWVHIQGALEEHRGKLATALEVHAFNRDVDDLNERINEKATAVSSDDYGADLAGVQALQRRQDDVERDMTALHAQLGVSLRCFIFSQQQCFTSGCRLVSLVPEMRTSCCVASTSHTATAVLPAQLAALRL